MHPTALQRLNESELFRQFILTATMEGIQTKYNVELNVAGTYLSSDVVLSYLLVLLSRQTWFSSPRALELLVSEICPDNNKFLFLFRRGSPHQTQEHGHPQDTEGPNLGPSPAPGTSHLGDLSRQGRRLEAEDSRPQVQDSWRARERHFGADDSRAIPH